ncbi:hypothetical protein N0V90_011865 [Kalmusia sp. IMI 367209]|nr:hypothetical protein N0V90_011865 [Kalmusia sp. IMI 367209]
MLLYASYAILPLSSLAQAYSKHDDHWAPPGSGDVRGPCPALNSLANHHIIPHDGKNLTVPLLVKALNDTLNISPELSTITATGGLNTAPDPSLGYFNLNHLNKHNAIEHDASLTRVDFAFVGEEGVGKFDYQTFKRWFSHFHGQKYIDIESAARARFAQVQHSREHNMEFTYVEPQRIASYAETVLYLKTMVDEFGRTRKDFVRTLFEEERLPFHQGWKRPKEQMNGLVLADNVLRLALATPEKTSYFGESISSDHLTHGTVVEGDNDALNVQGPSYK